MTDTDKDAKHSYSCDLPMEAYDGVFDEKYVILKHSKEQRTVLLARAMRFHSQIVDATWADYGRDWDVEGGGILQIDNDR